MSNFEMGKLTREIEEKNQKLENYEINTKNLNIKMHQWRKAKEQIEEMQRNEKETKSEEEKIYLN